MNAHRTQFALLSAVQPVTTTLIQNVLQPRPVDPAEAKRIAKRERDRKYRAAQKARKQQVIDLSA